MNRTDPQCGWGFRSATSWPACIPPWACSPPFASEIEPGTGPIVDVAMLDAQLAMLSYQAAYSLIAGVTPPPQGSGHDSIPTYRTFPAGDARLVAITANTEGMWRSACKVLGVAELIEDERFADAGSRLANREQLWAAWGSALLRLPADEWVEQLNAAGVPASTIRTVPEALADAEAAGRQMVLDLSREQDSARVVGNPLHISDSAGGPHQYPPGLGADTDQILRDAAGLSAAEIAALRADKVVG